MNVNWSVASSAIKLTIFAIVTTVATGLLAITIGNVTFVDSHRYRAIFSDVTGLQRGDDVRVAGVRVGEVESVDLTEKNRGEVSFSVDRSRPLTTSTRAIIRYKNLVGQRYLALTEGPGSGEELPPNGVIPLAHTTPALDLTVLFNGFRPLFQALSPKQVNQLAYEIIQVLQGEAGTVNGLLAKTASLTNTIAQRDKVIGRLIDNLNTVLATVNKRDKELSHLITTLQQFVSGLAADRKVIGNSLENINALAGTTAGLIDEGRPAIHSDIANLNRLSKNLSDNEKIVDDYLNRLPSKLNMITRTASYGSWFNFYLCSFDAAGSLPTGEIRTPAFVNETKRCQS
jgi:phospholipid/cholesterol/gamma-HCH transport system substrate-binding protein